MIKWAGPLSTAASAGLSAIAANASLHGKYDPEKPPRYNIGELGKDVPGYRIGSRAGLVDQTSLVIISLVQLLILRG